MRILTIGLCLLAACEHSRPYDVGAPDPLGPKDDQLPRRISFSTGDDRHPAVSGDVVVYSRLDPDERERERCLAFLPYGGGTIRHESCPPPQRTPADTFVDTWIEPALSPDGRHVAYMWQQGSLISVLGFASSSVVVAPADGLGDTTELVWPILLCLAERAHLGCGERPELGR